jgi:transcriptional regulator with XRE-family HTH domain
MDSGALGEAIRHQREQSSISMRRCAAMAGISNPYLSQIERGLRAPSERVIDAIALSLEVPADRLYEQAGLRPQRGSRETRSALAADPGLTGRQRRALLEIYDAFAALNDRAEDERVSAGGEARAAAGP